MADRWTVPPPAAEIKVVLLGDTGVGKSSLAQRFVTNNFKQCESTIGASFLSKVVMVNGVPVKVNLWDTAGQEKYHSLAGMYYRGAAAAILVYDVTSLTSFEKMKDWAAELGETGPENVVLAVAGNKSDLRRQVDSKVAAAYAAKKGALFLETSAKDNVGVADLFAAVANRVPTIPEPDATTAADQFTLDERRNSSNRRCCF